MARASLPIRFLTFSVCLFAANSADLQCPDIRAILSGYLDCGLLDRPCSYSKANIGPNPWWNFGSDPRTYKNRYCDKCHLERYGQDCKDNSCPHMGGPAGTAVDLLPSDSEYWICPRFCTSMPQIPIKMNLVKYVSAWECKAWWDYKETNCIHQNTRVDTQPAVVKELPMSTAFKTSWSESTDTNTYAVRPISECKTKRYEDNFNNRVSSCWQWSSYSGKPQMTHLDVFWTDGAATAYTFNGVKEKTHRISQCASIDNTQPRVFHSEPCWMGIVSTEQRNKQFSIKPSYTYYTGRASTSAPHDCRMRIVGANNENSNKWDDTAFLPPSSTEWNINSHWSNPPTRSAHFYRFKTVFDAMQEAYGQFSQKEYKTVATWDFTIPCKEGSTQQRSSKVYYAESGCTEQTCVDFITKPCYDNIYRFDEMVCTLIQRFVFPMKFSAFKDQITPWAQRQSFMSYGESHFEIWYDTAKVQVRKDTTITVTPNQRIAFTDDSTIDVSLIRDASKYSCKRCHDHVLHGRAVLTDSMDSDIIACRACLHYEYVSVSASGMNYQDCVACDAHQIRNPDNLKQCRKCIDIDPLTPMRRRKTATAGHSVCTTCQHFQYFDGNSEAGCIFLQTVTDNIRVVNSLGLKKAVLSGKDFYITGENLREFSPKFWRDDILPSSNWSTPLVPVACLPTYVKPTTNVPRLQFTAWCGHHEIVRHQQAWVQVDGSTLYVPLNGDLNRTRINTSVVELCGTNALTQLQGNTAFDLACGAYKFSIRRSGFQDPCTLCLGAKYTDKCWPTYVPGLELYDDVYFNPANNALTPHPGTCADCNARCDNNLEADSYIDPVQYSCWWNGTGRVPGVLGATATNFSWYKRAPCTKCTSVKLTADLAKLVLACGNRVSYRRWIDDTVTSSEDATRSVPDTKICCVEAAPPASGTLCTEIPAEFQTFAQLKCRQTVDDTPPAFLPYCPPGWYVEPTCAAASPLWNPDCCVKCKTCRGGLFKLDAYKECPGDEFFDAQDRGCTTKCLTNQYLRNDRCIKCEACE